MKLRALCLALLACAAALSFAARAADYPTKPVRIIIPFPPGGTVDRLARLIAARLTERWGQPALVESRPGAGGNIAYAGVAASAPDGYTMLIGPNSLANNPSLYRKVNYDLLRDFMPITLICSHPSILVTHPSIPVSSVQEMVAWSKANPGKATFASAGTGTLLHLMGELFKIQTGANMVHVPYKGSGPVITDLLGGQVAMAFLDLPLALPHVRAGKMRAIAVSSIKRSQAIPELVTIAESGLPGFDSASWFGLFFPARVPKEIADKTYQEVTTYLRMPETRAQLTALGEDVVANTSEEFAEFLRNEVTRAAQIIKASGATLD